MGVGLPPFIEDWGLFKVAELGRKKPSFFHSRGSRKYKHRQPQLKARRSTPWPSLFVCMSLYEWEMLSCAWASVGMWAVLLVNSEAVTGRRNKIRFVCLRVIEMAVIPMNFPPFEPHFWPTQRWLCITFENVGWIQLKFLIGHSPKPGSGPIWLHRLLLRFAVICSWLSYSAYSSIKKEIWAAWLIISEENYITWNGKGLPSEVLKWIPIFQQQDLPASPLCGSWASRWPVLPSWRA